MKRRDDLQCWRAISILAVLVYHIWPRQFPNGFIGVDIFFVLSGYLMASLYSYENNITKFLINFYYRRSKRILPVYLVIILTVVILLSWQLPLDEYKNLIEDSTWASMLATNYQDSFKHLGYFEMISRYRFFRHCWSLAVEMQFYLIFPLIGIARSFTSLPMYRAFLIFILALSLFYQATTSNSIAQYEFLECRIWQFIFGILAQTVNFSRTNMTPYFLISNMLLLLAPIKLPSILTSFAVLTLVAAIISSSSEKYSPFKFLSNLLPNFYKYFIFLGDISYILYLVHWPIITYRRISTESEDFRFFEGIMLFSTSMIVAVLAYEIIEKPILNLSNGYQNLVICLTVLYLLILGIPRQLLAMKPDPNDFPPTVNEAWEALINYNQPFNLPSEWTPQNNLELATKIRGGFMAEFTCAKKDRFELENDKDKEMFYCEHPGGPGNLTAVIIGNSFAMNVMAAVIANPIFKNVTLAWGNGKMFPNNDIIEKYFFDEVITKIQPDVLFIVQRYFPEYLYTTSKENLAKNVEFQRWNRVFKDLQNYTSAIVMNKEQVEFEIDVSLDWIRRQQYGLPTVTRMKTKPKSKNLDNWLDSLNCPKCAFFDYRKAFCDQVNCDVTDLDTDLPLFRDTEHITVVGLRRLKKFIDNAITKALKNSNVFNEP